MTSTREKGYVLTWDQYDGRSTHIEEFKDMESMLDRLDELSELVKNHIIWYNILQKVEAGTYTENTYRVWVKTKAKHNIPEPRIGEERLRF